jgi:predicted ester cyclase
LTVISPGHIIFGYHNRRVKVSIEENKALVRYCFTPPPPEVMQTAKDPVAAMQAAYRSAAEELFAPDFVFHTPGTEEGGRDQIIQFNLDFIAGFPDQRWAIDKMVAEGDTVVVVGRGWGTHTGVYSGIPPTGKKINVELMVMYRIEGGKFVEAWSYLDTFGLMQQLGAIPKH